MSKVDLGAGAPKSTWTKEKEKEYRKPYSGLGGLKGRSDLLREREAATETIVHFDEGEPLRYPGTRLPREKKKRSSWWGMGRKESYPRHTYGVHLRGGGMVKKRK